MVYKPTFKLGGPSCIQYQNHENHLPTPFLKGGSSTVPGPLVELERFLMFPLLFQAFSPGPSQDYLVYELGMWTATAFTRVQAFDLQPEVQDLNISELLSIFSATMIPSEEEKWEGSKPGWRAAGRSGASLGCDTWLHGLKVFVSNKGVGCLVYTKIDG